MADIVEIIQPCITFFDTRKFFKDKVYWLDKKHRKGNIDSAFKIARMDTSEKVPCGIIYQTKKPTFEELV